MQREARTVIVVQSCRHFACPEMLVACCLRGCGDLHDKAQAILCSLPPLNTCICAHGDAGAVPRPAVLHLHSLVQTQAEQKSKGEGRIKRKVSQCKWKVRYWECVLPTPPE